MKRYDNNSVLIIPDTHAPYHHPDTIPFLTAVKKRYRPDRVFHAGDWTDSYCFSRFPKDPDMKDTFTTEYKAVLKFTERLVELFPEGTLLKGNHDVRAYERAKVAGIPRGLMIPYEQMIGLDKADWKLTWDYTFTVDANRSKWYISHTKSANAFATAKLLGMSVVFGHNHTMFKVESFQSINKRIYGVNVGCLIGDDRYAFGYNKQSIIRPNRGCVVILRGIPRLVPFDVGPGGRWNKVVI